MNLALDQTGELHYSPLETPMLKVPAVNGGVCIIKSQSYYRSVTAHSRARRRSLCTLGTLWLAVLCEQEIVTQPSSYRH